MDDNSGVRAEVERLLARIDPDREHQERLRERMRENQKRNMGLSGKASIGGMLFGFLVSLPVISLIFQAVSNNRVPGGELVVASLAGSIFNPLLMIIPFAAAIFVILMNFAAAATP